MTTEFLPDRPRADLAVFKGRNFDKQQRQQTKENHMNTTTQARSKGETLRLWVVAGVVACASALFALAPTPAFAAPAAGTVIGNQATATYNDAGGRRARRPPTWSPPRCR